ncbi:MAG: hypothetical protein ACLQNE_17550 [Thermoguttaceae bacterium]
MTDFGKGPTLEQAFPWLRNDAERVERIIEAAERNSVIEGLPPFAEHFQKGLLDRLSDDDAPPLGHRE